MTTMSSTTFGISLLPAPSLPLARSLAGRLTVQEVSSKTPFELFQLQLESQSLEATMDAMHRLTVVAQSLLWSDSSTSETTDKTDDALDSPPSPVMTKLVAYLQHSPVITQSPPDELLLLLGQELSKIIRLNLIPRHQQAGLLELLEPLAATEETVVRDQAVVVVNQICNGLVMDVELQAKMSAASLDDNEGISMWQSTILTPFVQMWKRLATADWFTSKISAAGMSASILELVHAHVTPATTEASMTELLNMVKDLCGDDTPMVRRAAAQHLGKVLKAAKWTFVELIAPTLPLLVQDEQDSVRRLAVSCLADVGTEFGTEHTAWTVEQWLPLVKNGSTDMSWRVRKNLATAFSAVANNLGIQGNSSYNNEQSLVMACFATLLTDSEAEVRAAAVTHLARMLSWGGAEQFATHLQPLLPALADDPVMEVRSKCALALMDAAESGTLEDAVILQTFEPLLEAFLQDEYHEVQLQVLVNLHKVSHLLPGLSGVVTSLLHMTKATNWRVREAIAKLLPHLAEARGIEFFQTVLLEPVWMPLLLDSVASVRAAVVHGMQLLVKVAGDEWVLTNLFPQHVALYQNTTSYLIRNTIVMAHVEVACQSKSGQLWQEAVGQILRGVNDKVANVRMVSAKGLGKVAVAADGDSTMVQTQIRPALEKRVAEEEDPDCRAACVEALERIK